MLAEATAYEPGDHAGRGVHPFWTALASVVGPSPVTGMVGSDHNHTKVPSVLSIVSAVCDLSDI